LFKILIILIYSTIFVVQCPHCAKAFVSQEYLTAHLTRRHNGDITYMNGHVTKQTEPVSPKHVTNGEIDPDKLAMMEEMKQIKERLYATERDLVNERAAREMNSAKVSIRLDIYSRFCLCLMDKNQRIV